MASHWKFVAKAVEQFGACWMAQVVLATRAFLAFVRVIFHLRHD